MDTLSGKFKFDELSGLGIAHHGLARLENERGAVIRVEAGSVWLTQDRGSRDVLLGAGESWRIEHDGRTLISTLGRPGIALVSIDRAAKEPKLSPAAALVARLRRLAGRLARAFAPQWEPHELNTNHMPMEFGTLAALYGAGLSSAMLNRMISREDRRY